MHRSTSSGRWTFRSGRCAGIGALLLWASLVPVLALCRPYGGLVQDARIYIGRALADRDPAGLGRDLLFADDAQTGFSALGRVMRWLLATMAPGAASMLLASIGLALWLCAAVALARRLVVDTTFPAADGRLAWASVVAMLALPPVYGAFDVFGYAEAVATPRVFAEAAVLASFAAMLAGRRPAALAFLLLAGAIHPLMALPGFAAGACLLVRDDRRWLAPLAALTAAVLAAAALKLPVLDRLFVPMDPTWLGILRSRSANLFPTAWPADSFGRIAVQVATAAIAGGFAAARVRALLWSVVAAALGGLLASVVFGDLFVSVLVAQLQPWRALWPLAVLGNAGFVLAAAGLWRAGAAGRLALAVLIMAWATAAAPALAAALAAVAVALSVLARRSAFVVSPRAAGVALAAAFLLVLVDIGTAGLALVSLFGSMRGWAGEAPWPYVVVSGASGIVAVAVALAVALAPPRRFAGRGPVLAGWAAAALLCWAASVTWDSRTPERRMIDRRDGAASLAAALGPGTGPVLWMDEDGESWFLARRAAFFNGVQGAPILFSRDLALAWAERGRLLRRLGLVRDADLAPWSGAAGGQAEDIGPTPDAVARFCSDPGRPAALVAPGDRLAAVPPGLAAGLWSPPAPIRRRESGGTDMRWRSLDVFTVVRCTGADRAAQLPSLKLGEE